MMVGMYKSISQGVSVLNCLRLFDFGLGLHLLDGRYVGVSISVGVSVCAIVVGVVSIGVGVEQGRISLSLGLPFAKMVQRVCGRVKSVCGGVGVSVCPISVRGRVVKSVRGTWYVVSISVGVCSITSIGVGAVEHGRISLGLSLPFAKMVESICGRVVKSVCGGGRVVKSVRGRIVKSISDGMSVLDNFGRFFDLLGGYCSGSYVGVSISQWVFVAMDSSGGMGIGMKLLLSDDARSILGNDSAVQVLDEASGLVLWFGHHRKGKACKNEELHLQS